MLPTFNLPGKNISPDRQLAMMRTYLNDLKDNTEGELYDIKWENLAKPLKEKIEALEGISVSNKEYLDELNANTVRTQYLESEFVYAGKIDAGQIKSGRISTTYLDASLITTGNISAQQINVTQLTGGFIAASHIDAETIRAGCVNADLFNGRYINADYIDAATIRAGCVNADLFEGNYIKTNYISSDIMRTSDFTATNISAKYSSSASTAFEFLNCNHFQPWDSGYDRRVSATFQQVSIGGHVYRLLGWQVN